MSSSRPARKSSKGDYIETDSGNKVSRKALITGTPNITLAGRTVLMPDVHLRGDIVRVRPPPPTTTTSTTSLDPSSAATAKPSSSSSSQSTTAISIGKSTIIATSTILRPPARLLRGLLQPYPLKIGEQVLIGPGCVVESAQIHNHVHVGARCVLGAFSVLRENCRVLEGSCVPAGMVVPPGAVVAGRPARVVGEVGEGFGVDGVGEGWVEGGELREVVRGIR
ncbi:trimeric LpxA-like protein [Microthyrium microscopicum]|uniref:Dynactin subunit 5 n=1 Tax=Microthyrium microscopicum TaxID=703497 RepID=A0A6A6UCH2_9PEZI|nr:trimeric LpxA-like protein [Microthyrium microscopicum]